LSGVSSLIAVAIILFLFIDTKTKLRKLTVFSLIPMVVLVFINMIAFTDWAVYKIGIASDMITLPLSDTHIEIVNSTNYSAYKIKENWHLLVIYGEETTFYHIFIDKPFESKSKR